MRGSFTIRPMTHRPTQKMIPRRLTASPARPSGSSRPAGTGLSSPTCRSWPSTSPLGPGTTWSKSIAARKAPAPADASGTEPQSRVRLVQNQEVYAAMLEQLDTAVGPMLAELDRTGVADRTIVTFTSDNGSLATAEGHPTSNQPLRAGKGWPYRGGNPRAVDHRGPRHYETRQHVCHPGCQHRLLPDHS